MSGVRQEHRFVLLNSVSSEIGPKALHESDNPVARPKPPLATWPHSQNPFVYLFDAKT